MNKLFILLIPAIMIFFAGCGYSGTIDCASEASSEPMVLVTEEDPAVAVSFTEEAAPAFQTLEEQISHLRTCEDFNAYRWMVDLKVEEVDYIEFLNLDDPRTPYRRFDGEEVQEVVDLFQKNTCIYYLESVSWPGYFDREFHIIMKDGTAHSVCSVGNAITVIDGAAFETVSHWIDGDWPFTGNTSLPENWEEDVASRNYQIVEDEISFLGTRDYRIYREALDRQYDTSVIMGSDSRNYPIGRGTVTLSAHQPGPTGVTLDAYWTGTFRGGNLMLMPEFWIEQWVEESNKGKGCYVPLVNGGFTDEYTAENTAENAVQWRLLWGTTLGSLEPGFYRIGMAFYENINGIKQNETICYAKFKIP